MLTCTKCKITKSKDEYYTNTKVNAKGEEYDYTNPKCKVCLREAGASWRKNNPEKRKLSIQKDNARPEKRELMDKLRIEARENGSYREWQRNNKDKMKKYREDREHKKHNIKIEDWNYCKGYFENECAYCGLPLREHMNMFNERLIRTDFHKEHVIHEGRNDITNCVPSCKSCNSSKRTYELEEWYTPENPNYSKVRLDRIYRWLSRDVHLFVEKQFGLLEYGE